MARKREKAKAPLQPHLGVEELESRVVPTINAWINPELVTLSFVGDGTVLGSTGSGTITSNLESTFNTLFGAPNAWQNEVLRAAQEFAQHTNLNFALVSDNGTAIGGGSYQQGDPNMGDIRIGGYNFGSTTVAQAYAPPPINNYSIAGDIQLNTGTTWSILGLTYDLFTVAQHEVGHSLGLYHNFTNIYSAMYPYYLFAKTGLHADDITAIQALYGGARADDSFDATASNGSFSTATDLTSSIDSGTKTALHNSLDITSNSDVDYFKFTVPTGSSSTLSINVQSEGLSMLSPKVTVYASDQTTVLGTADGAGEYGASLNVTVNNISDGDVFYIKVEGATSDAFGIGAYGLALNMGTGSDPEITPPDTSELNGATISSGGGQAIQLEGEFQINTTTSGTQEEADVAVAADGSYVVVWTSSDGDGTGIYGQRYDGEGNTVGSQFRVNTETDEDQEEPVVAMAADGSFVVVWTSEDQDGDDDGIFAQRFDANGHKVGGELRVNTETDKDQDEPDIAMAADGSFVVVWTSEKQDGDDNGIYGQLFDANGHKVGGELQVNTETDKDQQEASVAMAADGTFVVVWESENQDGSNEGVYGQRFDSQGHKLGSEFRVNTHTSGEQDDPAVAMSANGDFVVVWEGYGQDGSGNGIFAQRFDAQGVKQGGEIQVNTHTSNSQSNPAVVLDSEGNFMVTWESYGQDGSSNGIFAQQFGAGGLRIGTELPINSTTSGDQRYASVALNDAGDLVVVWQGNGPDDSYGIVGQRFSVNGASGLHNLGEGAHGFGPVGAPHDHDHDHHGQGQSHSEGCQCCDCTAPAGTNDQQFRAESVEGDHLNQSQTSASSLESTSESGSSLGLGLTPTTDLNLNGSENGGVAFRLSNSLDQPVEDKLESAEDVVEESEEISAQMSDLAFAPIATRLEMLSTGSDSEEKEACDACFEDQAWLDEAL